MDEIALECKEHMLKTVEAYKADLSTLRTGRATPAMLDSVKCEYYGDMMPINQIAQITSPEPRQLLIKPYDRGDVKAIATAINASNLGLNPMSEGDSIRITIPALTEDSRKELVKRAKSKTEDSKVAIRNIRRDFIDLVKEADDMTEDYQKRVQEDIQKVVDEIMKQIDDILAVKEKEIMAI